MRRALALALMGLVMLAGCESGRKPAVPAVQRPPTAGQQGTVTPAPQPAAPQPVDEIVARVNGQPIRMSQLGQPLLEAYGLNVLLNLVQLEMAKQEAAQANVIVTPEDIAQERELTLQKLFAEGNRKLQDQIDEAEKAGKTEEVARLREQMRQDNEQFLEQFLERQRISGTEFGIVLQTNAYLRNLAMPMLAGKITEENLKEAFGVLYGENIKVRHIQLANMQEVAEAQRQLAAGTPFEQVARAMSRDPETAGLGGELPAFSRNSPNVPEAYKQVAFALKEGEVSDPVQAKGNYYLIKLERKIEPKAVKYEDVKESVRRELYDRWLQSTINQLRQQLAQKALGSLVIEQPALKEQFAQRLGQRQAAVKDRQRLRQELEQARVKAEAEQPAGPATAPAATQPEPVDVAPSPQQQEQQEQQPVSPRTDDAANGEKAVDARPPATGSGSNTPDQPQSTNAEPATGPAN